MQPPLGLFNDSNNKFIQKGLNKQVHSNDLTLVCNLLVKKYYYNNTELNLNKLMQDLLSLCFIAIKSFLCETSLVSIVSILLKPFECLLINKMKHRCIL